MQTKLTDESIMPWGIHKGKKMANVPASYLLWLYNNDKCFGNVKFYIKENLDVLTKEK
jgi:uncharacterized protein (DUF3820 family)